MADEKANVNSVSNIRYIVLLSLLSDQKVATGMFCVDVAAVDIRINMRLHTLSLHLNFLAWAWIKCKEPRVQTHQAVLVSVLSVVCLQFKMMGDTNQMRLLGLGLDSTFLCLNMCTATGVPVM